jgi:hypothetical protein
MRIGRLNLLVLAVLVVAVPRDGTCVAQSASSSLSEKIKAFLHVRDGRLRRRVLRCSVCAGVRSMTTIL